MDGFGGGSMIQQLPPSVVISHTETNSFVRSDINAVYPTHQEQTQTMQPQQPTIQQEQIVVKEEIEQGDETVEEEVHLIVKLFTYQYISYLQAIMIFNLYCRLLKKK